MTLLFISGGIIAYLSILIYVAGAIIAYAITRKNLEQDGALLCGLLSWITISFFLLGHLAQKIYEKKNGKN